MSFIRYRLSRISLPEVPCEFPIQVLDYYPFNQIRLGYIKLPTADDGFVSLQLEKDLLVAEFSLSLLSGISFGENDEHMAFVFDENTVLRKILEEAAKLDISSQGFQHTRSSCRVLIFFADAGTGAEFRKRFMSDVLQAFDCMKQQRSKQEVLDQCHVVEPSTSFACPTLNSYYPLAQKVQLDGAKNKQFLLRHSSHSEICGSEQESELGSSRGFSHNNQHMKNFRATDSEVPSSPEKDVGLAAARNHVLGGDDVKKGSRFILLAPGLYIPPRLFHYLDGDLLSPYAKLQTFGSRNLLASVRTHLFQRGENGGLSCINIPRELSNPGYWRETAQLWKSYEENRVPNFDFAFNRLVSFLEWAIQTLDFVSDFGKLSAEDLMLCRNTRWHETAVVRKNFDQRMREHLINEEELLAVRNWCGILREKTVFDAAFLRASYLKVLDLGTMVTEGAFGSWNLRDLFRKLDNITDFTWLNCRLDGDECALLEIKNVEKLKRLVLHITKCDLNKFQQFFDRFGWAVDDEGYEIVEAGVQYEEGPNEMDVGGYDTDDSFIDDRDEEEILNDRDEASGSLSVETKGVVSRDAASNSGTKTTPDVQLDYAALSFAFPLYRTKQFTKRRLENLDAFARLFDVPKAVLMAKSIALNVPSICLRRALDFTGKRQLDMFSVGLPYELCSNIRPNRTPYKDVIEILDNMGHFVNRDWEHKEARFHIMVDYYAPERVVHLTNLVARAFPAAVKVVLRFETARLRDKDFYSFRRHMTDKTIPRNLCIFDLSIDSLTYRVPSELSVLECDTLEEFHLTLSGVRHSLANEKLKEDLNVIFNKLMNVSGLPNLHTIVLRINAPLFLDLCEMFVNTAYLKNFNNHIRTLGFVCTATQSRLSTIASKLRSVHNVAGKRLERLILDVRILGSFSKEQLSNLRDSMPNCKLEAQIGPEDCKYLDVSNFDREKVENNCYRSPSNSPRLDEGFDRHLCSDYSDEVIVQVDETSRISTVVEESNQTGNTPNGVSLTDDTSQPFSSQEIVLSKPTDTSSVQTSSSRVLRSGREIPVADMAAGPSNSGISKVKKRACCKIRKLAFYDDDDDISAGNDCRRSRRRRQKKVFSSAEESSEPELEKLHSRRYVSLKNKDSVRKRRVAGQDCVNTFSEPSLSSNSDEWSPNKAKKTRRSRRSRRNKVP